MGTKHFFKISTLLLIALIFNSCNALTYVGKVKDSRWENDIVYQTLTWDSRSSEEDIRQDFTAFVREILFESRYLDYVLLFQSNHRLEEGERTYVIKIFQTTDAKNIFLRDSQDIIRRTRALTTNDFTNRWEQLNTKMTVEEVYGLLPELANFRAEQRLYLNNSLLRLSNLWLSFDLRGFLVDFGKGNVPAQANEWVF
jgi:hypothetical protein